MFRFNREETIKFLKFVLDEIERSTDEKPNIMDINIEDIEIGNLSPKEMFECQSYTMNIREPEYKFHITLNPKQFEKWWNESPLRLNNNKVLYMQNALSNSKIMHVDKIKK